MSLWIFSLQFNSIRSLESWMRDGLGKYQLALVLRTRDIKRFGRVVKGLRRLIELFKRTQGQLGFITHAIYMCAFHTMRWSCHALCHHDVRHDAEILAPNERRCVRHTRASRRGQRGAERQQFWSELPRYLILRLRVNDTEPKALEIHILRDKVTTWPTWMTSSHANCETAF